MREKSCFLFLLVYLLVSCTQPQVTHKEPPFVFLISSGEGKILITKTHVTIKRPDGAIETYPLGKLSLQEKATLKIPEATTRVYKLDGSLVTRTTVQKDDKVIIIIPPVALFIGPDGNLPIKVSPQQDKIIADRWTENNIRIYEIPQQGSQVIKQAFEIYKEGDQSITNSLLYVGTIENNGYTAELFISARGNQIPAALVIDQKTIPVVIPSFWEKHWWKVAIGAAVIGGIYLIRGKKKDNSDSGSGGGSGGGHLK